MNVKTIDIEQTIIDIEKAELIAGDENLDRAVREDALVRFVQRNASDLIELLDELKDFRNKSETGTPLGGLEKTHRVIIEGFSDQSAEAALSAALDKTAPFFAETHDVAITVQQLIELPGGGHRATLEIRVTPIAEHQTLHVKGRDIELKRDKQKKFKTQQKKEVDDLHRLIFDHFSALTDPKVNGAIPASFFIDINDAKLMHYMLEKQFLKAEQAQKLAKEELTSAPEEASLEIGGRKVLVRFNAQEPA